MKIKEYFENYQVIAVISLKLWFEENLKPSYLQPPNWWMERTSLHGHCSGILLGNPAEQTKDLRKKNDCNHMHMHMISITFISWTYMAQHSYPPTPTFSNSTNAKQISISWRI